jgi:hypothetical protein
MHWPTWGEIAAVVTALALWRKVHNVHLSLNSRLDEWKAETAAKVLAAHAQGRQDERDSKGETQ